MNFDDLLKIAYPTILEVLGTCDNYSLFPSHLTGLQLSNVLGLFMIFSHEIRIVSHLVCSLFFNNFSPSVLVRTRKLRRVS